MSFSVALPLSGYAGWTVLQRTMAAQQSAMASSATVQATETYFREKIYTITSADQLVSDYRLLSVVLTAFGLEQDLPAKAFVRKVLAEGTTDASALANRLSDKSYHALSAAFGFGEGEALQTGTDGFADKILSLYEQRSFEAAVGEQNEGLRIALNAERILPELGSKAASINSKWYSVIASKPLSAYMQGALGLPGSIASLHVDQQLEIYKAKARAIFGSDDIAVLSGANSLKSMTRNYLVRDQIQSGATTSPALQLLQSDGTNAGTTILSLLL